jgi:hypothetical protein
MKGRSLSMRGRIALAALSCLALAGSAACLFLLFFAPVELTDRVPRKSHSEQVIERPGDWSRNTSRDTHPAGKPSELFEDRASIEDGGFATATRFTGAIHNPESLEELREAVRLRGRIGLGVLQAELDHISSVPRTPRQRGVESARILFEIGLLHLYDGRFSEASTVFETALGLERFGSLPPRVRAELLALLGIVALRQGELDNPTTSLTPLADIVPIAPDAAQAQGTRSRQAIAHFTASLQLVSDPHVRWLLNIAHIRLGEYPQRVPAEYLIPLEHGQAEADVGRFENVARMAGLTAAGPTLAGGSVFDDFTGDGFPDLLTTSLDTERGAELYVNRGDGTFEHPSATAGLLDQVYALSAASADFDNDGDLDVVLLRGGWERPLRLSLLRNNGDRSFLDVTVMSGLGVPIASGSAAWGDYDNDGWVDLFVCGEFTAAAPAGRAIPFDPRNRCRLYHNEGDGTFVDVAAKAGVANERLAKGSAWGDYDGDGRLDLFVSNFDAPSRLYRNEGNGTFRDVAPETGVAGPAHHHALSCWFWDFDNDGRLDLFVNDFEPTPEEVAVSYLDRQFAGAAHPHLYRNLGAAGFRDVSAEAGLNRPIPAIGANFADIDNDGYLDAYFGTGWISYSGLTPNLMLKNVAGRRFEDLTWATGTGHLKHGHGISFADCDGDGDLDFFVRTGGFVPGDKSHDLLFRNPGRGSHWLKIKLVGTKTNRAALGARIRVELESSAGRRRSIYRTVGNNSSSGGNSLVESIGLAQATAVATLTIAWPASGTAQTFRDVAADRSIEISEGAATFQVLEPQAAAAAR